MKTSQNELQTLLDQQIEKGTTITPNEDRQAFNQTLKRYVDFIKPTATDYIIKFKNRDWTCRISLSDPEPNLEELHQDTSGHDLEFEYQTT